LTIKFLFIPKKLLIPICFLCREPPQLSPISAFNRLAVFFISLLLSTSKFMEEEIEVESSKLKRAESVLFCTLPDPPSTVAAIGRHESAEIWWTKDYGLEAGVDILEWEVSRYRKDKKNGKVTWSNKGSMTILQMGNIHQCIFFGLKNHCEYRFTVTVKTVEGYSMESRPSNMVYVDAPPPVGWKLFYDQSSRQYYYFNNFFRYSQIARPEEDPYYIENHVARSFSKREIRKLKEIWIEEMMHFEMMSNVRLKEILSELGEEVTAVSIRDHMKVANMLMKVVIYLVLKTLHFLPVYVSTE
jgi:hypothetical protein